jgi:hypothetical protein
MDNLSLSGADDVLAVQHVMHASRDNTSAINMKPALKSSATVSYGTTRALSTTVAVYAEFAHKDPNTSAAWTSSAIDALEFGAEVA